MRKTVKNNLLEVFKTIYEAHEIVKGFIDKKEYENAQNLLADCQDTAIQLGNLIEESEGEGFVTVAFLEEYCETLYEASINLSISNGYKVQKQLDKKIIKAENSAKNDIKIKLEIVFMPYKASMWDSLESVWKAADEDPDCDAYVVPIPYYDRKPGGAFGEFHYEGGDYPDYVPVVHYEAYNLEQRRPDVIYIHNPYDGNNYVTSVDPRFYSSELKKYTDKLVYIPYFVLDEPELDNEDSIQHISRYVKTPGVINSDKVIVQSKAMRQAYIKILLNQYGDTPSNRKIFEDKIESRCSPKIEKVISTDKESLTIPQEWEKIITKSDGEKKKIVFYNTSIGSFLSHNKKMLEKIESVLEVFFDNKDEVVLLWRPHPLLKATIASMCPQLLEKYERIVYKYISEGWGIYDSTSDLNRAITLSDAYYGDYSSVARLYTITKKCVQFQNPEVIGFYSNFSFSPFFISDGKDIYIINYFNNLLFKINEPVNNEISFEYMGLINTKSLFKTRKHVAGIINNDKLYLCPCNDNTIVVWDLIDKKGETYELNLKKKEFKTWGCQNNFRCCLLYKNKLFMFPSYSDAIICFDFEKKEQVTCLSLKEILEKINYTDDVIFASYIFASESIVLIPFVHSNWVLEFDLETYEYKMHEVNCPGGFITIHKYKDNFILLERQRPIIHIWDYKNNSFEMLDIFPDDFTQSTSKALFGTHSTCILENELYCFEGYSNMSIKVNLDNYSSEHLRAFDKFHNEKLTFHSVYALGNYIYIDAKNDNLVVYNTKTEEIIETKVQLNNYISDEEKKFIEKNAISSFVNSNDNMA